MTSSRFRLDGRTAVVTGGAGFLGRQWTAALVEAGATVVSADIVEGGDAEPSVRHAEVDITDPISVRALASELVADGLHVDILVNNAAVDAPVGSSGLDQAGRFETFPLERWHTEIDVGLTGALVCSQVFGAAMAARQGGTIVSIGSDLGLVAPDQRLYRQDGLPEHEQPVKPVTYSVIKSGLIGLSRYLSTYWADQGVRSNVLCLGGVARNQDETFVERVTERIPMGRMAREDEYREALVFLASPASSYMTGSVLVADGGRTAW